MLTRHELNHCAKILHFLDLQSITSLKDTVTKGLIITTDRQEAINAILEYSNTVLELLARRKVKREALFKYLIQEKVNINPSDNKEILIQSVLSHIKDVKKDGSVNLSSHSLTTNAVEDNNSQATIKSAANNFYCRQVASNIAEADQQIAKEFLEWFYPMLNGLQGTTAISATRTWSADHFWPECRLRCKLPDSEQSGDGGFTFETHEGSESCEKRLSSFVTELGLVFNANDTPSGYRGRINEHGMAKVAACGTIHKHASSGAFEVCGVFEQLFGLLRDPLDNNRWKIKFSDLSVQLPSISDHSHSQPSLSVTAANEILLD